MKIKAAVLSEIGLPPPYAESRPLTIAEVELDPPGAGEVLVKVAAAGLCHSDLSVINGTRPRPLPMVLGHEAAGVVAETGAGVTDLAAGDHVVFVFVPSCGHCLPCMEGRPALCEPGAAANGAATLLGGARRLHRNGETLNHHVGVSCFAEYATVSRRSLVKIDPALPLDEAALFGCAVITGVGAVVNTAAMPPGATMAVVGLGGVGLNAVLGGTLARAARIVAIDVKGAKLDLARQLGATDTFDGADPDCAAKVRELTGGGVAFAFEMAGTLPAWETAYGALRRGGTLVSAGLTAADAEFAFKPYGLVSDEKAIKGSYMGSAVPERDIPRLLSLYRQGKLPVDRLRSGFIALDDINAGFDRLADGEVVRQILAFPR